MTPLRKLRYNMVITAVSIVVAVAIAGIELLGLARDHAWLKGASWQSAGALAGDMNGIGFFDYRLLHGRLGGFSSRLSPQAIDDGQKRVIQVKHLFRTQ